MPNDSKRPRKSTLIKKKNTSREQSLSSSSLSEEDSPTTSSNRRQKLELKTTKKSLAQKSKPQGKKIPQTSTVPKRTLKTKTRKVPLEPETQSSAKSKKPGVRSVHVSPPPKSSKRLKTQRLPSNKNTIKSSTQGSPKSGKSCEKATKKTTKMAAKSKKTPKKALANKEKTKQNKRSRKDESVTPKSKKIKPQTTKAQPLKTTPRKKLNDKKLVKKESPLQKKKLSQRKKELPINRRKNQSVSYDGTNNPEEICSTCDLSQAVEAGDNSSDLESERENSVNEKDLTDSESEVSSTEELQNLVCRVPVTADIINFQNNLAGDLNEQSSIPQIKNLSTCDKGTNEELMESFILNEDQIKPQHKFYSLIPPQDSLINTFDATNIKAAERMNPANFPNESDRAESESNLQNTIGNLESSISYEPIDVIMEEDSMISKDLNEFDVPSELTIESFVEAINENEYLLKFITQTEDDRPLQSSVTVHKLRRRSIYDQELVTNMEEPMDFLTDEPRSKNVPQNQSETDQGYNINSAVWY